MNPDQPIIPPRDPDEEGVTTSIRAPPPLIDTLDFITERESGNRYSRNDIHLYLLRWSSSKYVTDAGLQAELQAFLEKRRLAREAERAAAAKVAPKKAKKAKR